MQHLPWPQHWDFTEDFWTKPAPYHEYEAATKFDSQHRRLQEIISRKRGITGFQIQTKKLNTPRFSGSYWNNPNAMDINRLTTKEREKHYKENRCFNCHKIGHWERDCWSPKQENQTNNDWYKGIKKTANAARAMIRNLVADMDDDEKEKLLKDMEMDQGFKGVVSPDVWAAHNNFLCVSSWNG